MDRLTRLMSDFGSTREPSPNEESILRLAYREPGWYRSFDRARVAELDREKDRLLLAALDEDRFCMRAFGVKPGKPALNELANFMNGTNINSVFSRKTDNNE